MIYVTKTIHDFSRSLEPTDSLTSSTKQCFAILNLIEYCHFKSSTVKEGKRTYKIQNMIQLD